MSPFAGGLLLFGKQSNWHKILAVLGILLGIALTVMG
jgi:drug/metabolite transporter (DMT)-like permease